jgi:hypothetical protein
MFNDNEPSTSVDGEEFLDQLDDCQLLMKNTASCEDGCFPECFPCTLVNMTNVTEVLSASIIRTITDHRDNEAPLTTSVNIYQTARRNIPENSHLHSRRENLESHLLERTGSGSVLLW